MQSKKIKKMLSIIITIILLTNSFMSVCAVETTSSGFIETTDQVYLDNIDVAIVDKENLIFTVSPDIGIFQTVKAKKDIEKLESFFDEHDATESIMITFLQSSDLCAISYTETPLVLKEDHYERVSTRVAETQSAVGTSRPGADGNFTLTTSILRTGSANSAGEYLYTAMTSGEWSDNSIIGGRNYPASGEDYVIQTTCEDFVLDEHGMITQYNDGDYGTDGSDSYSSGGGYNFIKYNIKDDPFGTRQLQAFLLMANYYGPAKNYTRAIHSVYTHTWKSLSIQVSVEAGIDVEMTPGVGIVITPSLDDKSWDVFTNVTFRF